MKYALAILILAAGGLHLQAAAAQQHLRVMALDWWYIPHMSDYSFTMPGTVQTTCYGTSPAGYTNCSSVVNPPQYVPLQFHWLEVYNRVLADGMVYTIRCRTRLFRGSCAWLEKGDTFPAVVAGHSMRLRGHRDGNMGKVITSKYRITDIRRY